MTLSTIFPGIVNGLPVLSGNSPAMPKPRPQTAGTDSVTLRFSGSNDPEHAKRVQQIVTSFKRDQKTREGVINAVTSEYFAEPAPKVPVPTIDFKHVEQQLATKLTPDESLELLKYLKNNKGFRTAETRFKTALVFEYIQQVLDTAKNLSGYREFAQAFLQIFTPLNLPELTDSQKDTAKTFLALQKELKNDPLNVIKSFSNQLPNDENPFSIAFQLGETHVFVNPEVTQNFIAKVLMKYFTEQELVNEQIRLLTQPVLRSALKKLNDTDITQ